MHKKRVSWTSTQNQHRASLATCGGSLVMSYNDVLHQSEQCSLEVHSAAGASNIPDKAKTKSINPCADRFCLTDSVDAGTFPLIITQSFILRGYIRNIHLL